MTRPLILSLALSLPLQAAEPTDLVRDAATAFNAARSDATKYAEAATLFAKAAQAAELTPEQTTAWAYCRLRLAAEDWNRSRGEAAVATRVIAETHAALDLVPQHDELQKFGTTVLAAAGAKPKAKPIVKAPSPKDPDSGWFVLEGDNFKVRYPAAAKATAEKLLLTAEELRITIFTRWSGPPTGAWLAKCELILHPSPADFAHATNLPKEATGHAFVTLDAGTVTLRRIDLRTDDNAIAIDALPRELTHIILADLFPTSPPPKWAAEGMATLAMSADTQAKYLATAAKLATDGKLPQAVTLLELTSPTAEMITPFAVGSAALAEFLVKQKGERSLTVFIRDSKRYGVEKSLERQFGFASVSDLDQQWRKQWSNR